MYVIYIYVIHTHTRHPYTYIYIYPIRGKYIHPHILVMGPDTILIGTFFRSVGRSFGRSAGRSVDRSVGRRLVHTSAPSHDYLRLGNRPDLCR